jgi:hypothetical protein
MTRSKTKFKRVQLGPEWQPGRYIMKNSTLIFPRDWFVLSPMWGTHICIIQGISDLFFWSLVISVWCLPSFRMKRIKCLVKKKKKKKTHTHILKPWVIILAGKRSHNHLYIWAESSVGTIFETTNRVISKGLCRHCSRMSLLPKMDAEALL